MVVKTALRMFKVALSSCFNKIGLRRPQRKSSSSVMLLATATTSMEDALITIVRALQMDSKSKT